MRMLRKEIHEKEKANYKTKLRKENPGSLLSSSNPNQNTSLE